MNGPIKVFIEKLTSDYLQHIQEGLSYLDIASKVKPGDSIFIKPNLTFPYYKEGVTTTPECIEQLVIALKDYSSNITIGEADGGGYNRFSMESVFEGMQIHAIAKRHNVKLVNLSKLPAENIHVEYYGREYAIPLPQLLLNDVNLFITVPVPKVHSNTRVSLSIKNQWGCIQEPSLRLALHPYFRKVVYEINKALNVRISVVDGRYGLNRNGPMRGEPVKLGWIIMADNIQAADIVCCSLMGIDPLSVDYLRFYSNNELLPSIENYQFNQNYSQFIGPRFYLKRELLDYPGYFAFRFRFLSYLAYHSPVAKILHKSLYLFREKFYDHD